MAAYFSMARAVGPRKRWSRALLFKLRNRVSYPKLVKKKKRVSVRSNKQVSRSESSVHIDRGDKLRKLVPGGKSMDFCSLLEETAHYITCLNTQLSALSNSKKWVFCATVQNHKLCVEEGREEKQESWLMMEVSGKKKIKPEPSNEDFYEDKVKRIPESFQSDSIREFCFQRATLIFCTASSSYKLHRVAMQPLSIVVIDEAAQLTKCESTISLQLPGVKHAVLAGDECQLPATVTSNVYAEAGFARSSFERILDAPNVKRRSHEKHYLPGAMFGLRSFINVIGGREEKDEDGHSQKNMVEVANISKMLLNLYKGWVELKQRLSIGIVSPYAAQVVTIQDRVGEKYNKLDGFVVKSFKKLTLVCLQKSVPHLLLNLSSGWRPKKQNFETVCGSSSMILKKFKVEGLYSVCTNDTAKDLHYVQVLNIWDILFLEDIPKLINRLDSIFIQYTDDFINLWKEKCLDGDLEVPKSWPPSLQYSQFKDVNINEAQSDFVGDTSDCRSYVEHIPKLMNCRDSIFHRYTDDFISLCKEKCLDGDLEVPKSWLPLLQYSQFKDLNISEAQSDFVGDTSDCRSYVEHVTSTEIPKYFKGLWHGTTILWVRLSATELIIGVDSLTTTTYIEDDPNDPNNRRKYEIMWSEVEDKFIEIIPKVYATLSGDGERCLKMVEHVRDKMKGHRDDGVTPILGLVGLAATEYFRQICPFNPDKDKLSTVFLCAWISQLKEYHVIVVADVHEAPLLIEETVFGSGSGFSQAVSELRELTTPIDVPVVKDKMIRAECRDPHTGGRIQVISLKDERSVLEYQGYLLDELDNPVYADIVFDNRNMFVVIRKRDEKFLNSIDLARDLKRFDTNIARDQIHWLFRGKTFLVYLVKLSSSDCCDSWYTSCMDYKKPFRCQPYYKEDRSKTDYYYLTYASRKILDRARSMKIIDDLVDP
ncbi:PREDICTED: uncharacterized protein LOC101303608 [Fragaria vesca subsp. vesca]